MEKGYEETKTRDVSEKVGIAEGTLFNYFPSKAGLFLESMAGRFTLEDAPPVFREKLSEAVTDQVYELLMSRFEGLLKMPKSVLKEMTVLLLQFAKKKSEAFHKLWEADARFLEELEKLIRSLVEKGMMKECDPVTAAAALFSPLIFETLNFIYLDAYKKEDVRREVYNKLQFILKGWINDLPPS
jgi:AcrR family transcriptional regulator